MNKPRTNSLQSFILCLFTLFALSNVQAQQKVIVSDPDVIQMEFLGETVAARDIDISDQKNKLVGPETKLGYHKKKDWPLHESVNPNALPKGLDPAWQEEYAPMNVNKALLKNFEGNTYTGANPADPIMDVGPNHVVQMVNGAGTLVAIYDKSGALQTIFSMAALLGSVGATGGGDPIVVYDAIADRWLLSEFGAGNSLFVAISTTPDPTGTYYPYTFSTPSFPDYPKYAVWSDAYYVTTNENMQAAYALDRDQMLLGLPATSQRFTMPDFALLGFQAATPVTHDTGTPPPAGSPGMIMRMADDAWDGNVPDDRLEIWDFVVDFDNSANSSLSGPTILLTDPFDNELCGFTSFFCFEQPGSGISLDPLREVLMNRVQYRNFGGHESIVCNHVTDVDDTDHGGVRWYELQRTGGIVNPWSIYQQGTYAPDNTNRWMAAIAINECGDIGLMYNVSDNATVFPGLRYTGRSASDPLGTMTIGETIIAAGSASNGSNRYGDYNSLDTDPSNGTSFWGTGMYNPSSTWSTRITEFDISQCADECAFDTEPPTFCGTSSAEDVTYDDGWQDSENDGSGFGPWTLTTTSGNIGENGHFAGSSVNNDTGGDTNADGDIDSGGRAFGMYANSGNVSEAIRPFDTPMIPGSRISLEMDNGFIDPGGTVGFGLQNSSGDNLLEFYFAGNDSEYTLSSNSGANLTGIPFTVEGLRIEIVQLDLVSCQPIVVDILSGNVWNLPIVDLLPSVDQEIAQLRLFNANAGLDPERDLFFNNFEICYPCPDDIMVDHDPGVCGTNVNFTPPIAFDNCPGVSVSCSPVSGSFFDFGTTTVTCTATDARGNIATCSFTVTVEGEDTEPPTISCDDLDVTVSNDLGECGAFVEIPLPIYYDNCCGGPEPEFLQDPNSLSTRENQAPRMTEKQRAARIAELWRTNPEGMERLAPKAAQPKKKTKKHETASPFAMKSAHTALGISAVGTINELDPNSTLNNVLSTVSVDTWGGDYHEGIFYGYDASTGDLYSYDETGASSFIGTGTQTLDFNLGLAYNEADDIWYAMDTDCSSTSILYQVDISTGAKTMIGNMGVSCPLWLAIDNDGNAYCADAFDDNLHSVDLSSGATTFIGSSLIEMVNIQDADFSPIDGTLYVAGENLGVREYYEVNTTTGEFTSLGPILGPNGEPDYAIIAFAMLGDASDCTVSNSHTGGGSASGFYPVGNTVVTYTVRDAANNSATCSFTVIVEDNEAPLIACGNQMDDYLEQDYQFSYVSIVNTGELLVTGDDDFSDPVTLGSPIPIYGSSFDQLVATTNGLLMDPLFPSSDFDNDCPIPELGFTSFLISPMHDDLDAELNDDPTEGVYYEYFPVSPYLAPSGIVQGANVFEWKVDRWSANEIGGEADIEFQAVLFDDGDIVYLYNKVGITQGNSATVGIQAAGPAPLLFTEISCNEPASLLDNSAVALLRPNPIIELCLEEDLPPVDLDFPLTSDNCTPHEDIVITHVGDVSDGLTNPETIIRTYRATDAAGNSADCILTIIRQDLTPPQIQCGEEVLENYTEQEYPFSYVDIVSVDNFLVEGDDAISAPVILGAPITIYGSSFDQLVATTNGLLLDPLLPTSDWSNDCPMPELDFDSFLISPMHDDLDAEINDDPTAGIYYEYFPVSPYPAPTGGTQGASVFQWKADTWNAGGPGEVAGEADRDFQVVLFDNGDIVYLYNRVGLTQGNSATVGIQSPGPEPLLFTEISCNEEASLTDGYAVALIPFRPTILQCPVEFPPVDLDFPMRSDDCTETDDILMEHLGDFSDGNTDPETITRVYRATDEAGNSADCEQIILVNFVPIEIVCPNDTVIDVPRGACSAVVDYDVEVIDKCPDGTLVCTPPSGSEFPAGVTTVNCVATDAVGTMVTCSFTVSILSDHLDPVLTCPEDVTVASGDPSEPSATGTATATDNCDPDPVISHYDVREPGGCLQDTVITRVWKAEDFSGNTSYCIQMITVEDTTTPVIDCPGDVMVSCEDSTEPEDTGMATAVDVADPEVVITHLDISSQTDNGSCSDHNYSLVRVWYAEDACGNSTFCKQTITVFDITPPEITCPGTLFVEPSDGLPEPDFAGGSTSDNCDGAVSVTFVSDVSDGLSEPETVMRTYLATDACGNTAECSHLIIIDDITAPMITCPGPVSVICIEDVPSPDISAVQTNSDCGATVIYVGDESDGNTCPETITRTYLATDNCGNSMTCEQTITVHDMTPPTMTCPGDVNVDCSEDIPEPDFAGGTTDDNCDAQVSVSHVDVSDGNLNPEVITRTYRASDECGNTVECTQTITVFDTEDPVITCPADIIMSTDPGSDEATVSIDLPGVSDNCCGDVVQRSSNMISSSTEANHSAELTDLWERYYGDTPPMRGLSMDEEYMQERTLFINEPRPAMRLGGSCENPVADSGFEAGVFSGNWTESSTNFGTPICNLASCGLGGGTGPNAGDFWSWFGGVSAFEEGSISQTVDIPSTALTLDFYFEAPVIADPNDFLEVLVNGDQILLLDNLTPSIGYSLISVDISGYAGSEVEIEFHSIINGSLGLSNFFVDDIDIICDGEADECGITLSNDQNGTSDASGTYPLGTTTVNYLAIDARGNSSTCSFTVTVVDSEGPVLTCADPVDVDNDAGLCSAALTLTPPTVSDNVTPSENMTPTSDAPSPFPVGETTVTWSAVDGDGNTGTCTQLVTVNDVEPPVIDEESFVDFYEVPFDPDLCGAEVDVLPPTASDNCGIESMVNDYNGTSSGLDVYPAGKETDVTWTISFNDGTTESLTATVKVGKLNAATGLNTVCFPAQNKLKFKWTSAPGAQRYRIQMRDLFGNIVLTIDKFQATAVSHTLTMTDTLDAGNYQWRVISYCKMDDAPNLPGWQEYAKRYTSWKPLSLPCTNQAALPFDDSSQSIKLLDDGVEADVYPNPTEGIFYLDTDLEDYTLEVYDLKGQMVYNETRMKKGITELDLQEAPNGMYLLKMYNNSAIMTKRITIQR